MESPLKKLVVDEKALSEEALAGVLAPLASLTTEGAVMFRPGFTGSNRMRVLVGLLATSAAHRLGLRTADTLAPRELEELTGIKGGTLRPLLRGLVEKRLIAGSAGSYRIPPFAFFAVAEEVRRGDR